jgi:hypothetical protein
VAVGTPGEAIRSFREHLLQRQADAEAAHLAATLAAHVEAAGSDPPSSEDSQAGAQTGAEAGAERGGATDSSALPAKHGTRSAAVGITHVAIEYPADPSRRYLCPGEPLTVRVGYDARDPIEDLIAGLAAYADDGKLMFAANNIWYPVEHGVYHGPGEFVFEFPSVPLLDGMYTITVGLTTADEGTVYDWHEQKYRFQVMNPTRASGLVHMPPTITLHAGPTGPAGDAGDAVPPIATVSQGQRDASRL